MAVAVPMEPDTLAPAAVATAVVLAAATMAAPLLVEPSTVLEQRLVAVAPAVVAQQHSHPERQHSHPERQHSHLARHFTVGHQLRLACSPDLLPLLQCRRSKHTSAVGSRQASDFEFESLTGNRKS